MLSTRAFRFNPSAAAMNLTHSFPVPVASPATTVARFYIYFATLPGANVRLLTFNSSANNAGLIFVASDNSLRAGTLAAQAASGQVVTTGQWYRVDIKEVQGATLTVDVSIDGSALAQYSLATAASSCSGVVIGPSGANVTADIYVDDIIVSGTSADFPIGAGTVAGLYPNADGSHNYSAATDFDKNGTTHTALATPAANETTSWQSLRSKADGGLSTTVDNANFVTDVTGGTGEYLRWAFEDLPAGVTTIHGVASVSTHHSATATSNTQAMKIIDVSAAPAPEISVLGTFSGSPANTAATGVDLSETTIITVYNCAATGETTGAWTVANVNDLGVHWSSTDVNPDPIIDGICLEVDVVIAGDATGTPVTAVLTTTVPNPTGGITVTPTTDVLTLLAPNPTGQSISYGTPVTALLSLLAQAPTGGITVTPVTDVVTLLAQNPKGGITVTPVTDVLTLLTQNPNANAAGTPVTDIISVLAQNPTGGITAIPTTDIVNVLAQNPTGGITATPVTDLLTLLAQNPTGGVTATPVTDVLAVSAPDPTGGATVTPTTVLVTITAPDPTGSSGGTNANGTPGTDVLTMTAPDPTGGVTVTPTIVLLTAFVQALTGNVTATPAAAPLMVGSRGGATVSLDATGVAAAPVAGNGPVTWSHTIGAGDGRLLVVCCAQEWDAAGAPGTVPTVTFDGVAMTLSADSGAAAPPGIPGARAHIFHMLDADLPAAGTYTVSVTYTTGATPTRCWGRSVSLFNAAQTGPDLTTAWVNSTGTGALSRQDSLAVVGAGGWAIDMLIDDTGGQAYTADAGQVNVATDGSLGTGFASSTKPEAGSGSTTLGWTWTNTNNQGQAHVMAEWQGGGVGNPTPNPTGSITVTPVTDLLSMTAPNPSATADVTVTPTTVLVTVFTPDPTAAETGGTDGSGTPTTAVITLLAQDPTGGISVTPTTDVLDVLAQALEGGATATPSPNLVTVVAPDPTGQAAAIAIPVTDALTIVAPDATATGESVGTPTPVAVVFTLPDVTGGAGGALAPVVVVIVVPDAEGFGGGILFFIDVSAVPVQRGTVGVGVPDGGVGAVPLPRGRVSISVTGGGASSQPARETVSAYPLQGTPPD